MKNLYLKWQNSTTQKKQYRYSQYHKNCVVSYCWDTVIFSLSEGVGCCLEDEFQGFDSHQRPYIKWFEILILMDEILSLLVTV